MYLGDTPPRICHAYIILNINIVNKSLCRKLFDFDTVDVRIRYLEMEGGVKNWDRTPVICQ